MKYVFIDANVLLSILELREIKDQETIDTFFKNNDKHEITFLQNSQLRDEVYALRDKKIKHELETLNTIPISSSTRFIFTAEQNDEIINQTKKLNDILNKAKKEAEGKAVARKLLFDEMMENYFKTAEEVKITDEIFNQAVRRSKLNKAPGKPDQSIGDRIHWETLLKSDARDLHIVTNDKDFYSELETNKLKHILKVEWAEKTENRGQITVDRSLIKFIEKIDEHITFSQNTARQDAIEEFESSGSFRQTHRAIENLNKFDDFSDDEVLRLIIALNNNSQIHLIAKDDDVLAFYKRFQRRGPFQNETIKAVKFLGVDEDFFDPS